MNNTATDWQVTLDLIRKYKINHTMLAQVLGITKSTFSLKMSDKYPDKFSDAQKEKITKYLFKMGEVLMENLEK